MGRITSALLTAKTKVAPISQTTIPRLELQAAVMLSKVIKRVITVCEFQNAEYYAWSDSAITLYWLRKLPHTLKIFVGNRVAAIAKNMQMKTWAHVESQSNPADLVSRGLNAEDLLKAKIWKQGPKWLLKDKAEWPNPKFSVSSNDKAEILKECKPKEIQAMLACTPMDSTQWDLMQRFSDWRKIIRITAIVLRYVNNSKLKDPRKRTTGRALSPNELGKAVEYWAKCAQAAVYRAEIECLKAKDTQLPSKRKITSLNPFLDENGVKRVGGRLVKAAIEYGKKHPIIIPPRSRLCYLIMQQAHSDTFHGNVQMMMAHIRNAFWNIAPGTSAVGIEMCEMLTLCKADSRTNHGEFAN